MDQASDIVCEYCGQPIAYDPAIRTPASAWSAPGAEEPTRCRVDVPGHAPMIDQRQRTDRPGY